MAAPADPGLAVVALGASTPLGLGSRRVAAAARAGVCGFREHPYMIDTAGEPMKVAAARWLEDDPRGAARLIRLLEPALDEALQAIRTRATMPLLLGLPPARPGQLDSPVADIETALRARYGSVLGPITTFRSGHAAGLQALAEAQHQLVEGRSTACLVACVDSYLEPETLEWIEANDQLHGGGVLNNAWGFIPGEAAAALLVTDLVRARRAGLQIHAEVIRIGLGEEPHRIKTDTVCIGQGLTQALRGALAAVPAGQRVDHIYCDLNGEAYRADEYGFSCLRCKDWLRDAGDFVAPADCWGDVGAAGAPLHVLLAVAAGRQGVAQGELALVWASSEDGTRGAALLRVPCSPRE